MLKKRMPKSVIWYPIVKMTVNNEVSGMIKIGLIK